jgi:hypothetical protein
MLSGPGLFPLLFIVTGLIFLGRGIYLRIRARNGKVNGKSSRIDPILASFLIGGLFFLVGVLAWFGILNYVRGGRR